MTIKSLGRSSDHGGAKSQLLLTVCCVVALLAAGHLLAGVGSAPLFGVGGAEEPTDDWVIEIGEGEPEMNGVDVADGEAGPLSLQEETEVGQEEDAFGDDENEFREMDESHRFTVESDRPSYWRIGSYETYTGTGWNTDRSYGDSDGTFEYERDGEGGEEISQRVTLAEPTAHLPTAWRPETIDVDGDLEVRSDGAARTAAPLEAGESYTVESVAPVTDPDVLREAGTDYPAEIEERYTQLPSTEPNRVGEFTSELTEGDETPYETAVTIESWLRSEKDYDLGATHDRSETVADQFIFEMEEGYCEYFATAMVSMLRNEDVPARYAVGYATGIESEAGVYEVSGTHAHAWVEVYFPGVGWVPFEPTPPADRQAGEEAAFSEAHSDAVPEDVDPDDLDLDHAEPDLPTDDEYDEDEFDDLIDEVSSEEFEDETEEFENETEEFDEDTAEDIDGEDGDEETDEDEEIEDETDEDEETDDETDEDEETEDETDEDEETEDADEDEETDDETDDEDADDQITAEDLDVELNETPIPGSTVEAIVSHEGDPVPGVDVTFNGEPVGTTDEAGTVSGTVPFSAELVVGLRYGGEGATEDDADTASLVPLAMGDTLFHPGSVTPPVPDWVAGGEDPVNLADSTTSADGTVGAEDVNRTFPVEGAMEVVVEGVFAPGGEIVVESTIEDRPVPEATVERNGTELGTTDDDGRLEATLPEEAGTQTILVRRGELETETEIEVLEPELSVDHRFGYSIAGTEMTITFEWGEEELDDVPIELDGTQVGETDENGTLTTTAPFAQSSSLSASSGPLEASTTVQNALRNAALLALAMVGLLVAGSVGAYRRYGLTPRRAWRLLRSGARALVRGTINGLIAAATWLEGRLEWSWRLVRRAGRWLGTLPWELYRNGLGVLVALDPRRLGGWLRRWFARKRRAAKRGLRSGRPTDGDDADERSPDDERTIAVRSLWREFLALVRPPNVRTKTPAEIATDAADRGFPAGAATTLADAFRDVEYGSKSVSDERLSRVRAAWESILGRTEEDDSRGDGR